jgi:drug/metabolite transporter (DMT)-like permease
MVSRPSLYPRIAVGVVAVSTGAVLVRLAAGASPLAVAAWRLVLASVVLVPIALARGTLRTLQRKDLALGVLSGAALAVHFVLWISSLGLTSGASSGLFVSPHPIFVGVHPDSWMGNLLALGGGLFAAVYFLIGRRLRPHVSLVDYTAITYGTAAALTLVACLVFRVRLVGFPPPTYLWLALLAIGPQLIGHSTFNWALRHLPAAKVSVLVLGEPVGAAFLAYLVFGETLTWLGALGATILLAGILISLRGKEVTDGTTSGAREDRMGG